MATRLEILYAQTQLINLKSEFKDWANKEQDRVMSYCWRASEEAVNLYIDDLQEKLDNGNHK